jgi:hypothetical protein
MDKKYSLTLIGILALVLLIQPVNAIRVTERCVDNTNVNATFSYDLSNNGNTTDLIGSQVYACSSGCSYTLNACRMDSYNEALIAFGVMGGILAFCALAMWISMKTDTGIYIVMLIIASVLIIIIAITDVFSAVYRTIFFGFAFVPGIFIFFARQRKRREDIDNPTGD